MRKIIIIGLLATLGLATYACDDDEATLSITTTGGTTSTSVSPLEYKNRYNKAVF